MDYLESGPQQRGNSPILPGIHRPVSHWGLKSGLVIHRKTFYFRWTFGVKVRVLSDPGPPHPINNYKQIVPFTLC